MVNNVTFSVMTPASIFCQPVHLQVERIFGEKDMIFDFYPLRNSPPTTSMVQIVASYLTSRGEPQSVTLRLSLPLLLFTRIKAATKSAEYKLVLDTEGKEPVSLPHLFDDFIYSNSQYGVAVADVLGAAANHAMGFQFWFNENVTKVNVDGLKSSFSQPITASILVSKANGRYRVQSDSMIACAFLLEILERKLVNYHKDPRAATFQDNLNLVLSTFFSAISDHYGLRVKSTALQAQLNDNAHQYRVICKRLLARFKDKNPSPLGGLELLARETYEKILILSDSVEDTQSSLLKSSILLQSSARLTALLVSLKCELDPDERSMLESHLCPNLVEGNEHGWEETVDASMTYLLKTSLATDGRETVALSATLDTQVDLEGLKRRIQMVVDRLGKGARIHPKIEREGKMEGTSRKGEGKEGGRE